MSSQFTLDYISSLDELDRLTYILDHFDSIMDGEFIEFLKGQLDFAKKEANGAGYFNKVFEAEDVRVLNAMKKEMKFQAVKIQKVWSSVLTVSSGLLDINSFDNLSRVSMFKEKKMFDENGLDDCISCGLPAEAEASCSSCS